LFELQAVDDVQNRIAFSQLLVVYPFFKLKNRCLDGLGLGMGPGIFTGKGAAFLSQLSFRLVWEIPGVEGVLVTAGPSVRWVSIPRNVELGTMAVLPRGSTKSAPPLSTTEEREVVLSIGIGLDLALLADAGESLMKAIKGDSK